MSSVAEGLVFGGESPERSEDDISGNADFMASLAADLEGTGLLDGEEPPAPSTPPVDAGTSADDDGDNSNAEGDEDEGLTPEQKEIKHLKFVLGRQGDELGELRKQVTERKPEEDDVVETYSPPAPITDEVVEQIEEAVFKQGGQTMAVWALTNRPDLYETVLDAWSEVSGAEARKAAKFDMRYENALEQQTAEQESAAAIEFQAGIANELDELVVKLAPEYGITPGTAEVDLLLAETVSNVPQSIKNLVVSKDAKEREDAVKVILALAATQQATTAVEDPAVTEAKAAALAKAKAGAGVGAGSLRPAPPANEGGGSQEPDFLEAFQKSILETPNTSVAAGLTFGNG